MKDLFSWLNGLSHKTAWTTAIMAALTFLDSSSILFGAATVVALNFVCNALLLIGKGLAPTGTLPKGWNAFMWITNSAAILIQLGSFFIDSGLFADATVMAITKIQIVLNAVIAAVQIANTKAETELK